VEQLRKAVGIDTVSILGRILKQVRVRV
jgi:hypothetical protein